MNYYNEIKEKLIKSEIYDRVKEYSKDRYKFSDEKFNPLGSKLSWSHYRELITIKNVDEIIYYIYICEKNNLSKRQLHDRIKSKEYQRLPIETKK